MLGYFYLETHGVYLVEITTSHSNYCKFSSQSSWTLYSRRLWSMITLQCCFVRTAAKINESFVDKMEKWKIKKLHTMYMHLRQWFDETNIKRAIDCENICSCVTFFWAIIFVHRDNSTGQRTACKGNVVLSTWLRYRAVEYHRIQSYSKMLYRSGINNWETMPSFCLIEPSCWLEYFHTSVQNKIR